MRKLSSSSNRAENKSSIVAQNLIVGSLPGYSAAAFPGASYPVIYLGKSKPWPSPSLLPHNYSPDNIHGEVQTLEVVSP